MKQNDLTQSERNIYNNLNSQVKTVFKHSNECSFKTRERYEDAMHSFAKFLAVEFRKEKIGKIKNMHIEKYVSYMQTKGYSTSYVTTNISAIRYFYSKLTGGKFKIKSNRELGVNPKTKAERIGVDRAIDDRAYNKIIESAKIVGRNDFVLKIKLAEKFGLRIHEVFSLRRSQIKKAIKNNELEVKGKGGLIRTIPASEKDKAFLKESIQHNETKSDRIFVRDNEKTHLKIKELQEFIREFRDNKNDSYKYTFHSIRHRYAQEVYKSFMKSGKSDKEARYILAKRLGHNRTSITEVYLK
ncbi:MAG: recombinase XerD [Alkaliphilus sp.]|nr:MAG: recombinase XerD [Alkaliphilus sp.]